MILRPQFESRVHYPCSEDEHRNTHDPFSFPISMKNTDPDQFVQTLDSLGKIGQMATAMRQAGLDETTVRKSIVEAKSKVSPDTLQTAQELLNAASAAVGAPLLVAAHVWNYGDGIVSFEVAAHVEAGKSPPFKAAFVDVDLHANGAASRQGVAVLTTFGE